jgi:hypothetical protein
MFPQHYPRYMLLHKITAHACDCLHGFKSRSSAIFRSVLGPCLFLLGWYYYEILRTYLNISSLQVQCWGNVDDSVSLQKWNYFHIFTLGGSGVLCKSHTIPCLQLCSILYRKMCGCNHSLVQALCNACMCTFCSWLQMITSLLLSMHGTMYNQLPSICNVSVAVLL